MGCWDREGNELYHSFLDTTESITVVALAVGQGSKTLVYLSGYTNAENRASFAAQFDAETRKQNWIYFYKGDSVIHMENSSSAGRNDDGGNNAGYSVSMVMFGCHRYTYMSKLYQCCTQTVVLLLSPLTHGELSLGIRHSCCGYLVGFYSILPMLQIIDVSCDLKTIV